MPGIDSSMIVTTLELAAILGVSERRVQQLQKEGTIRQIGRNEYQLNETIQSYVKTFMVGASRKKYQDERTKLTQANREKAEIELQIIRGEVHRGDDVKEILHEMLISFRSRLLVLPGRASIEIAAISDVAEIQQVLKREVYDALSELSEYDPAKLYSKSKDRIVEATVKISAKKKANSK